MKPTEEQQAVLTAVDTHQRIAVDAYAGCGKTTTLRLVGEANPDKRITYTAFNKGIVDATGMSMPANVDVRTTHSLAWECAQRHRIFDVKRQPGFEQARILGTKPLLVPVGDRTRRLAGGWIAGMGMQTLGRWCNSGDPEVTTRHVVWPRVVADDLTGDWEIAKPYLAEAAVEVAQTAWDDILSPRGRLRWDHSYYLKIFQLEERYVDSDMLMLDEAQDTNGVTMAILETAARRGTQLVLVGDRYQEIYAWRGAVNAMEKMKVDTRANLTGSWRFGPLLADTANLLLIETLGAKLPLRGLSEEPGGFGPIGRPKAILGRTNAAVIAKALELKAQGLAVQVAGGIAEITSFVRAAAKLMAGKRVEHPELGAFENWAQVQQYAADDPGGGDLTLMVELIAKFGVSKLLEAVERMDDKIGREPDVYLSTGHKAKGLEWSSVQLLDDFHGPRWGKTPVRPGERFNNHEAVRLLYVAVTRAQYHLDATAVPYLTRTPVPAS